MPTIHAQFCEEADTFADRMLDMDHALTMLITDMSQIARGAVRPEEARKYAVESMRAVSFFINSA